MKNRGLCSQEQGVTSIGKTASLRSMLVPETGV